MGRAHPVEPGDFDAFALRRRAQLIRLAWAITGDRELAEDLTQISLERMWQRWSRLPSVDGERWAYAQRVLISQVSTWHRRRWTKREIPTEFLPDSRTVDVADDPPDWLLPWLDALAPRQRAVIVLRFLADLSVDEAARVLGCSPGTVKSQSSKAIAKLRVRRATQEADIDE